MDNEFSEAFYEVDEIIELLPEELLQKIPKSFIKVIKENKSTTYKKEGISLENIKDLKKETRVILYTIYRDFLLSEDEAINLKKEENKIIEEKYSYESLFQNSEKNIENSIDNLNVVEVNTYGIENESAQLIKYDRKWYVKLLEFIKRKFR